MLVKYRYGLSLEVGLMHRFVWGFQLFCLCYVVVLAVLEVARFALHQMFTYFGF